MNVELQEKIKTLKELNQKIIELKETKASLDNTKRQLQKMNSIPMVNKLAASFVTGGSSSTALRVQKVALKAKLKDLASIITTLAAGITLLLTDIGDLDLFADEVLSLGDDIATDLLSDIDFTSITEGIEFVEVVEVDIDMAGDLLDGVIDMI